MSGEWIDVSVALKNRMAHWPGDRPFKRKQTSWIDAGDSCNLSEISGSVHTGTHMDAPGHFLKDRREGIDTMPLDAGIGVARVIAIRDEHAIALDEVKAQEPREGERILFRTKNSEGLWNSDEFAKDFIYIPADTAKYLAERRVRTVGVDYLSVGGFYHDGPETHKALLAGGIWIIEGLDLGAIEPGEYDLICLPLKLVGSDGAPARAVLRKR